MEKAEVVIIGAGVAGLIAALELEKAGVSPLIIEASDVPGGRLKTDKIDGYMLDHGFQVLLTAYPETRHYLDYEPLKLGKFDPGAVVFSENTTYKVMDPMRHPEKLISMLFSGIGKLSDKIKLAKLTRDLKAKSPEDIFNGKEESTLNYLRAAGFSQKIIEQFFKPFYSGIFLENELATSRKMFEFVFKMFAEGAAALPQDGIQAIPKQLVSQLEKTEIRYGERAILEGPDCIRTAGGEIKADDIIIATAPHDLLPGLKDQEQTYHSVLNLYFSCDSRVISNPMIGLVSRKNSIITNFCYPSALHPGYAPEGKELLSISVVSVPDLPLETIIKKVQSEWSAISGEPEGSIAFLREYSISHALPVMDHSAFRMPGTASQVQDHIFLAGDYLLYGSLNAAMTSGRTAAQALLNNTR